jgi:hypothetical protein
MSTPSSSNGASDSTSAIRVRGTTIYLFAILIVVLFTAFIIYMRSTGSDPCRTLEGAQFRATKKVPTFETDGFHYPTLFFKNGSYRWFYSDTFRGGSYECLAGELIISSAIDGNIEAQYDPTTGVWIWNGEMYRKPYLDLWPWLRYVLLFVVGLIVIQLVRRSLT